MLRFIQARFALPALSNRDANAGAMMDVFDYESAPGPPPNFPEPPVPRRQNAAYRAAFPDGK